MYHTTAAWYNTAMVRKKRSLVHTFKTRLFGGVVVTDKTTGKKRLKLHSERFYNHEVSKFNEGEEVTISITNKKPKRTLSQNSYYWGVYLPLISAETGEADMDAIHEHFKQKFLVREVKMVFDEPTLVYGSTQDLSVLEFNDFIANIYAETGVEPPPTENYHLAPLQKGI